MRGTIIAVAVLMYAAAIAVFGAGTRLPEPPASPPPLLLPSPSRALSPSLNPAPVPSLPPSPAAAADGEQLRSTMERLAREQAANRELVAELRSTVSLLEKRLADDAADRPPPARPGRTLAILAGLLFLPEQATLTPLAGDAVRALLPEMLSQPGAIVSVEGHADNQPLRSAGGRFKDNAELSLERARAVAAVLVDAGLPAASVRVVGWGDSRPQATNDTEAGRALNRRVEIRLLSSPGRR